MRVSLFHSRETCETVEMQGMGKDNTGQEGRWQRMSGRRQTKKNDGSTPAASRGSALFRPSGRAALLSNQKVLRRNRTGGRGGERWSGGGWLGRMVGAVAGAVLFLLTGLVMLLRSLFSPLFHRGREGTDESDALPGHGEGGRREPSLDRVADFGGRDDDRWHESASLELPGAWEGGERGVPGTDEIERAVISRLEAEEEGLPDEELIDQAGALRSFLHRRRGRERG